MAEILWEIQVKLKEKKIHTSSLCFDQIDHFLIHNNVEQKNCEQNQHRKNLL